jgi:hypothetical protein
VGQHSGHSLRHDNGVAHSSAQLNDFNVIAVRCQPARLERPSFVAVTDTRKALGPGHSLDMCVLILSRRRHELAPVLAQ